MMGKDFKLDRIDVRILSQLQHNGRISNVDLADAVGLSASPCLIRCWRLALTATTPGCSSGCAAPMTYGMW